MKVVCCTMFSPSHQALADISVPNLEKYCERHGYEMHLIKIENDKWEYKKHEAFKELFEMGYDLIWYRDVDLLITNMTIRIESFIDNENDLFITRDATEINGGSLILKNSDMGRWINKAILDSRDHFPNEQNAINWLMGSPEFNQWIKVLPQVAINAYDHSLYFECVDRIGKPEFGDWLNGSFVIHFPALNLNDRVNMLKEYSEKIVE